MTNINYGDGNTLGNFFKYGNRLTLAGIKVVKLMTLANLDGSGRQVKIIVNPDYQIYIEAGCFLGSLSEFLDKAAAEGKRFYITVVKAAAEALLDEVKAQGLTGGW